MYIKIVGFACPKVQQTLINAEAAASEFDDDPIIEWIDDIHRISELGRVIAPVVFVNGHVKTTGRIPSVHELTTWMEEEYEREEELAA